MAADKKIIAEIHELEHSAPARMRGAHTEALGDLSDGIEPQVALAEALDTWCIDLQSQADLWERSGAKGAKGSAVELRAIASAVAIQATGVRAARDLSPSPSPLGIPVERCGDTADHGPHVWYASVAMIGDSSPARQCDGPRPPRDLAGLDALIADARTRVSTGALPRQRQCPAADLGHDHSGPHAWICGPGKTEATCGGHPLLRENECCENMLVEHGEDPADWCDGQRGIDHEEHKGSCKFKAHLREDHDAVTRTGAPFPLTLFPDNGCTHGDGCPVHPGVHAVHNFDDATMRVEPSFAASVRAFTDSNEETLRRLADDTAEVVEPHAFEVAEGATGATCTAMVERDGSGDQCGLPPDSGAHHYATLTVDPSPDTLWLPSNDEVKAYLSGVSNYLPTAEPRGTTYRNSTIAVDGSDPVPAQVVMAARELGAALPTSQLPTAPALGQAGVNAGSYDPAYVPPGGRMLTLTELMNPVPLAALPPYLSHSQLGDAEDCAVKYRAQRVEHLTEVPQWANVGGTTLHRAIEGIERMTREPITAPEIDAEATWGHHWERVIASVAQSSGVPESRWRSSRKGAENKTWWEVNGPQMLQRYIAARPAEVTAMLPDSINGAPIPAIEYAIMPNVPTPYGPIPFKAEIDRITIGAPANLPGHAPFALIINDYKSSYDRPSDVAQLGRYAHALRLCMPEGDPLRDIPIFGRYFDARRGEWTEPIDLIEAYPAALFLYEVAAAQARKFSLTAGPTPARKSAFCGGCAVRYACPIMAARG